MQILRKTERKLKVFLSQLEGLGRPSVVCETGHKGRLNLTIAERALGRLKELTRIRGKRILDIGSGMGDFILASHKHGAICHTVEPDLASLSASADWFKDAKGEIHICRAVGEKLPFKEGAFDIVSCNDVLEHVANAGEVVKEVVRVLKPGGIFYLSGPNYLFPYEPHYKLYWFPFLSKRSAKIYLKLLRKSPTDIDHIYYVTTFSQLRIIAKTALKVERIWFTGYASKPRRFEDMPERLRRIIALFSPSHTIISRKL